MLICYFIIVVREMSFDHCNCPIIQRTHFKFQHKTNELILILCGGNIDGSQGYHHQSLMKSTFHYIT